MECVDSQQVATGVLETSLTALKSSLSLSKSVLENRLDILDEQAEELGRFDVANQGKLPVLVRQPEFDTLVICPPS